MLSALPLKLREYVYEDILSLRGPEHCWSAKRLSDECLDELIVTCYRINVFEHDIGSFMKSHLRTQDRVEAAHL